MNRIVASQVLNSELMRPLLLLLTMLPTGLFAQTAFFHFTNGTVLSYALTDMRKLTFVNDEQVLWLNDGTQYTWNVSTIGRYDFVETVGIEHIASGLEPLGLHLFPNPASTEVIVEADLPEAGRLVAEVLDLHGRVIRGLFAGDRAMGLQRLTWDTTDALGTRVAPGTYLVRLSTRHGSTAKPVVVD